MNDAVVCLTSNDDSVWRFGYLRDWDIEAHWKTAPTADDD